MVPIGFFGLAIFASCEISLGDDRLELTETDGPYMVLAYTFRGPEAETSARNLAKELRNDHDLPAYIVLLPNNQGALNFGILVGDCKTTREAFYLMKRIKKIEPKSPLNTTGQWRPKGLSRAMTTTNPLVKLD